MKKTLAIIISISVCVGLFQLFIHFLPRTDYFRFSMGAEEEIFGFSWAIAIYFLIAGNLFWHYLKLERWKLWCAINFVGYPLSYVVFILLEPWQEAIDIILEVFAVTSSLVVVWGAVGLGFLCVRLIRWLVSLLKK